MPEKTEFDIIAERKHKILVARDEQLAINILGWHGGRPYIDERLSRFAGETAVEWEGGTYENRNVTGRKQQTHALPYLARIVNKINQYTFSEAVMRDDLNTEISEDISRTGRSLQQIMMEVNSYLTVARWCWIRVDAPNIAGVELTQAEKDRKKIRPYWSVLSPRSVVDWKIASDGTVEWVLIEWEDYRADDPRFEATTVKCRSLWEPGKVTKYWYDQDDMSKIVSSEEKAYNYGKIPIFPVGEISDEPHFFDDTEGVNRSIMNLGSANYANFFRCVFPQIYLPISILKNAASALNVTEARAAELLMGFNYPVFLEPEDQVPGYIMPDSAGIESMRKEIKELVEEMYGTIGLIHQHPSKQVQSGISKEFDFQDILEVVKERADILEAAEKKAVQISHEWDDRFPEWTPKYNRALEVGSLKEDLDAITSASSVQMPPEMVRFILNKLYERLKKIGTGKVDPDEEKAILAAIEVFEPSVSLEMLTPDTTPFDEDEEEE